IPRRTISPLSCPPSWQPILTTSRTTHSAVTCGSSHRRSASWSGHVVGPAPRRACTRRLQAIRARSDTADHGERDMQESSFPRLTVSERIILGMRSGWSYARRFIAYQVIRRVRSYGVAVGLDLVAVTAAFETAVLLRFMDASDVGAALSSLL